MKRSNLKTAVLFFTCLFVFNNLALTILAQEIKIDFERYSVIFPRGNWKIAAKDEDNQIVRFEKIKTKRENSQICINYIPVLEPTLWDLSEEELAKNFIANEKLTMVLLGEKKGLYKLANVKEGTDIVNDKNFYTMSYQNLVRNYVVEGMLYVYIPPAEKHKELFAINFTEGHLKNKPYSSDLEEFIEVLKGLEIK